MKRVVLAVTVVIAAAIAAQAQSAGAEVRMTSASLRGAFDNKLVAQQVQTSQPKSAQLLTEVTRQVAQQVKRAGCQSNAGCHQTQAANQTPAAQQAKPAAPKTQNVAEGSAEQWIKAVLLGGRFPGESDRNYHDRLVYQSQPASLPFK